MTSAGPLELVKNRGAATLAAAFAMLLAYSCGSSSTSVTRPANDRCAVTLSANASPVSASGGTGSVGVATERECLWSATSEAAWLSITSSTSGQGDGSLAFSATGNPSPVMRRGALVVGQARAEISQAAAPCEFRFTPPAHSADAGGSDRTVAVDTLQGCSWSVASGVPWIVVIATENTGGPGTVRFRVESNPGEPRTGALTIAGHQIPVSQSGGSIPCSFGIAPSEQSVPSAGGNRDVAVTAANGCSWVAVSQVPWIAITNGATGTANGTVTLTVASNAGPARTGTITIAGQTHTVTQSSGTPECSYEIAPGSSTAPAAGGTGVVAVTARNGCPWTAVSRVPWITVSEGASGSGNGGVQLTFASNTGAARVGTVLIAGQTHTVSQPAAPAPCTYGLAPGDQTIPAAGATREVAVTTQATCTWTAVSQVPWITVTGGAAGSGNGTVQLTILPNPGAARTGTVLIGGQTHTVSQAAAPAPCTYSIAPADQSVAPAGATSEVMVTTQASCEWTAVSQVPWITVSNGTARSGAGPVKLTIAANGGPPRSGTVLIGGQTHTVAQAGPPVACTYSLMPTTQAAPVLGQDFDVQINTQPGCAWTAVSTAPWIAIRTADSGTGAGALTYKVVPNIDLTLRTGTIDIAGQVLTVTQAGILGSGQAAR